MYLCLLTFDLLQAYESPESEEVPLMLTRNNVDLHLKQQVASLAADQAQYSTTHYTS